MFSKLITVLFFSTTIFYAYGTTQLSEARNSSQLTEEEKNLIINNPLFADLFHEILKRVSSSNQVQQQQQENSINQNVKPLSQGVIQRPIEQSGNITSSQNNSSQISQATTQQEVNNRTKNSINQNAANQTSQINKQHTASRNGATSAQQNTVTPQASSLQTGGLKQKVIADNDQAILAQAGNARYQFGTRVDDSINGNFQQREETRDGNKVTGSYSYDDGYILRTVMYEADDKGFRIVKEEIQPSIKAQQNLTGEAEVVSYLNGDTMEYEITTKDNSEK